jgi:hypothetical protein
MNVNGTYPQPGYPNAVPQSQSTVQKRRNGHAEGIQSSGFKPNADDVGSAQDPKNAESATPAVSEDEKKFFQQLFPTAAEEIRTYTPYQRNGQQQPAPIGSLFDVKG